MVVDLIRGKEVPRAREILRFSERNVAEVVEKCLNSAVANAERNNEGINGESLIVRATYADEGPTMKRIRPRAKGAASPILKRSCHITVIVGTREGA
jgi:large subunit ribosomal protein L22